MSKVDPLINRQLGNYRLEKKLGAGACGIVYKAQHVKLGTPFAVKILHPILSSSTESSERFLREARTAARIGHENVVFIADFDVEEGVGPYFVMEYLDGDSLRQTLDKDAPFHAEKIAALCEQICHALAAAHRLGVVHRDLKPDNIMILPRQSRQLVKILDFGIAKITSPQDTERLDLTQSGHILGTPRYFSPEQAQGFEIDHRSDIYSFGIILYEMLIGHTPFQGRTPEEMRYQHIFDPPPPLGESFPNELQDLLDWLLSKHVDERPDDMDEVWSLLKEALPLIKRVDIPHEEIRETQRIPGLRSILDAPAPAISHTSGYQEDRAMAAVHSLPIGVNRTIPLGTTEHLPDSEHFLPEPTAPHIKLNEQSALDDEHTLHEKMLSSHHAKTHEEGEEGPTIYDPAANLRKILLASTQKVDGTDEIELPNASDDEDDGATVVAPLQGEDDQAPETVIATHRPRTSNTEDIGVEVHASILDAEDTATHQVDIDAARHLANLPSVSDDDLPTAIAHVPNTHDDTSPNPSLQSHENTQPFPPHAAHHPKQHTLQARPPESAAAAFLSEEGPPTQESLYAANSHTPPSYSNGTPTQSAPYSHNAQHYPHTPPHQSTHVDALLDAEPLLIDQQPWRSEGFKYWQRLSLIQKIGIVSVSICLLVFAFWGISALFTPTPPPPPKQCESTLKTTPPYAAVWFEGRMLGYTPYLLRRACASKVTLRFHKQGYLSKTQEVQLNEENSELTFPLQSDPAAHAEYTIQVFSTPSQAAIYSQQGQILCYTPCALKAPRMSQRTYLIKKRVRRRKSRRWLQRRFTLHFAPPHQSFSLRLR